MLTQPAVYYVSVEEFVPRDDVAHMLQVADRVEHLGAVEAKTAFKDVKRALVWMEKYIAPTSEFWDWSSDLFTIDQATTLNIQLVGYGWVITLSSTRAVSDVDVLGEEARLIQLLDQLTQHIPVSAVLRMKASRWRTDELDDVTHVLRKQGIECQRRGATLSFPGLGLTIYTEPGERLEYGAISRKTAAQVENILSAIMNYANKDFQGAGWCAYRRRRLTLIQKRGDELLSTEDEALLQSTHPTLGGPILSSRVANEHGPLATLSFVRAKYHKGNIHPRALLASSGSVSDLRSLSTYVYYLWNTHFTRMWLYLIFEDAYVFAHSQRSSKEYVDPKILHYWQNILDTDQIIAELHTIERVDSGKFQSYVPPHTIFHETPMWQGTAKLGPIEYLRTWLIEATTTQLLEDPLKRAIVLLEDLDAGMKTALDLFVQTVNIRMQKTLQILQFLFVVAAIAQVLQLMSIAPDLAALLDQALQHVPWYARLAAQYSASAVSAAEATVINLLLLALLTAVCVVLLKTRAVRNTLDRAIR